ncbi:MAG TPA: toprim domain-containing protein, partial [Thermomicrobiales bacterium]|nr:toprim domain-containing protein [Thermomicrobiales bacterium]
ALPGARPLLGRESVAGRRVAFVVEGVFDWLTAVEWGLPACSPGGTALAAGRLGALAGAARLYGVFDGDAAGRAAAARYARHFAGRWRTVRLPAGCDLNDLGRRPGGRARFLARLRAARGRGRWAARRRPRCLP